MTRRVQPAPVAQTPEEAAVMLHRWAGKRMRRRPPALAAQGNGHGGPAPAPPPGGGR
jgi:hypothetical protein